MVNTTGVFCSDCINALLIKVHHMMGCRLDISILVTLVSFLVLGVITDEHWWIIIEYSQSWIGGQRSGQRVWQRSLRLMYHSVAGHRSGFIFSPESLVNSDHVCKLVKLSHGCD